MLDADHLPIVNWFIEHINGVWRRDINGAASLDYGQIYHAMQIESIEPDLAAEYFQQLRHIERGYLS